MCADPIEESCRCRQVCPQFVGELGNDHRRNELVSCSRHSGLDSCLDIADHAVDDEVGLAINAIRHPKSREGDVGGFHSGIRRVHTGSNGLCLDHSNGICLGQCCRFPAHDRVGNRWVDIGKEHEIDENNSEVSNDDRCNLNGRRVACDEYEILPRMRRTRIEQIDGCTLGNGIGSIDTFNDGGKFP